MSGFALKFLTRDGCRLCMETLPVIRREAERAGHTLAVVDVDADPGLTVPYGSRVPVLLGPGDQVIAEGVFDNREVRRNLRNLKRRARRRP